MSTSTPISPAASRPDTAGHRLLAVAAAGASALFGWSSIRVFGDTELVVGSGADAMTIGGGRVVVSAVVAALCGWALLAVVERRVRPRRNAMRQWRRISWAVTAVSLLGPLTADAPTSTQWSLVALHASVAAVFISAMSRPTLSRHRC